MFKAGDRIKFKNAEVTVLSVYLKTGDLLVQDANGNRMTVLQNMCKLVEKTNGERAELRSRRSS